MKIKDYYDNFLIFSSGEPRSGGLASGLHGSKQGRPAHQVDRAPGEPLREGQRGPHGRTHETIEVVLL